MKSTEPSGGSVADSAKGEKRRPGKSELFIKIGRKFFSAVDMDFELVAGSKSAAVFPSFPLGGLAGEIEQVSEIGIGVQLRRVPKSGLGNVLDSDANRTGSSMLSRNRAEYFGFLLMASSQNAEPPAELAADGRGADFGLGGVGAGTEAGGEEFEGVGFLGHGYSNDECWIFNSFRIDSGLVVSEHGPPFCGEAVFLETAVGFVGDGAFDKGGGEGGH